MSASGMTSGNVSNGPPRPADRNQAPKRRGMSGCVIALIVVSALILVGGVLLLSVGLVAAGAAHGMARDTLYRFREVTLREGGPKKVLVIPVEGIIMTRGALGGGGDPVEVYKRQLLRAEQDKDVAAVILTINSPGGGITATDVMHRATVEFRKRTGRPVVACLMDTAASGGYYLAAACDHIVSHSTTLTGSIGVLMPIYDVTDLMSKVGVKTKFVTSGDFKMIGSPFVERTPEQEEADRELLQTMVDSMYEQFIGVVATGRKMPAEAVRPLADGRIFTGAQARQNGLVDQVGYFEDAVSAAERLSGTSGTKVVTQRRIVTFLEIMTGQAQARRPMAGLEDLLNASLGRPLYLWMSPDVLRQR